MWLGLSAVPHPYHWIPYLVWLPVQKWFTTCSIWRFPLVHASCLSVPSSFARQYPLGESSFWLVPSSSQLLSVLYMLGFQSIPSPCLVFPRAWVTIFPITVFFGSRLLWRDMKLPIWLWIVQSSLHYLCWRCVRNATWFTHFLCPVVKKNE